MAVTNIHIPKAIHNNSNYTKRIKRADSAPVLLSPLMHPINIIEHTRSSVIPEGTLEALSVPDDQDRFLSGIKGFFVGSVQYPLPSLNKQSISPSVKNEFSSPPSGIENIDNVTRKPVEKVDLPSSQEELFQGYMLGKKDWHAMVDEARIRERRRRSITLNEWGVKPENYEPAPFEDTVIRSGTDPCIAPGRGEFSDEDLTATTQIAWERIRELAKSSNLTIEEDREAGFFRIPELNTIVWQPIKHAAPLLPDAPDFVTYNVTAATHPEVVDPSSAKPKFAMEYIVAMVNKGQVGFSKPVEKWGKGYARYETLIQMAKSTHHAMLKSGLAEKRPEDFDRLWKLCKMEKSPEELGIFRRNDPERNILQGLRQEQTKMQSLCRQSFILAQETLDKEMENLQKRIVKHKRQQIAHLVSRQTLQESAKLIEDVKDADLRLEKIATQLKIQMISDDHRKFARNLFDSDSKKSVEYYIKLDSKLQAWSRELTAFLEAELIAQKKRYHTEQPFYPSWVEALRAPTESLLPDSSEQLIPDTETIFHIKKIGQHLSRKKSISLTEIPKSKWD